MSDIYLLCYRSRAKAEPGSAVLQKDIEAIIAEAVVNNRAQNITGALFYSAGYYCQILEGQKGVVSDLYGRICKDSRHSDIKMLAAGYYHEPAFANWSMGYAGTLDNLPPDLERVLKSPDALVDQVAVIAIKDLLLRQLEQLKEPH